MEKFRSAWWIPAVFALVLFMALSCGSNSDDDDDDNDDGTGGAADVDCSGACDGAFQCGGSLWYESVDECISLCGDWAETNLSCADCFIGCFDQQATCVASLNCLLECSEGPCLEELSDFDQWLD
jgi:hypothetical protein